MHRATIASQRLAFTEATALVRALDIARRRLTRTEMDPTEVAPAPTEATALTEAAARQEEEETLRRRQIMAII